MNASAWFQLALFLSLLLALAWPLSLWLARLATADLPAGRAESLVYRGLGVDARREQDWKGYAIGLMVFNLIGIAVVYALQLAQAALPLNPQQLPGVSAGLAFNTAVSFVTNTNWQAYSGESGLSHLTQMLGLAVQNFLSAATGIAVAFVLMRAFARRQVGALGNVWVDLARITCWVLLPLSFLLALVFVSQGVIQNFSADVAVTTLQGGQQMLAQGPVASQEAIKMLGTNGGGFFNANSAHPYENPTAFTNLLQMLAIFLIPAALCLAFGRLLGDRRQGVTLLMAMVLIFIASVWLITGSEQAGNPALLAAGADSPVNLEGKEARFGIVASSLFATVTTAASCGAVNAMHDSLTPLGGMVPMALMQLGEVVFGGVGAGFYGIVLYALLAVFIAGLMVGRSPEYLGKKIELRDMQMAVIAILVTPVLVLTGTAIAVMSEAGLAGRLNEGAHGFSEILYAFSSAANNNGSAFAGLSANSPFYNGLLALAMFLGRFGVIVPVLALAGSLAAKPRLPVTGGTLPTHGPLFVILLVASILLIGALNFLPSLVLGPIAEHLQMLAV
ncbi:UNVERIFIED_CONTAM: kdpA [Trichonephila clavipes]